MAAEATGDAAPPKSRKISPYRRGLLRIFKGSTEEDLKTMKYVCQDVLARGKLEKVQCVRDLFDRLEENGEISEAEPDFVYELLAEAERADLARIFNDTIGTGNNTKSPNNVSANPAIVRERSAPELQQPSVSPLHMQRDEGGKHLARSQSEGSPSAAISNTPIGHTIQSNTDVQNTLPTTSVSPVHTSQSPTTTTPLRQRSTPKDESRDEESTPVKRVSDSSSDDDDTPLKPVYTGPMNNGNESSLMDDLTTDMADDDISTRLGALNIGDGAEGNPHEDLPTAALEVDSTEQDSKVEERQGNQAPDNTHPQNESPPIASSIVQKDSVSDTQNANRQSPGKAEDATILSQKENREVSDFLELGFKSSFKQNGKDRVELRKYQKELAQPGIEGNNYIICAPTGSGKTLTAAFVCRNHHDLARQLGEPYKIIFIVPTQSLITQQRDAFRTVFPPSIVEGIGETDELATVLKSNDVVVLTAQILINALNRQEVQLTGINILILDECHHTTLNHPYHEVMRRYVEIKVDSLRKSEAARLPLVIGLSASLGVGKEDDPLDHVITLAASMDAALVKEVTKNVEELNFHVKPPVDNRMISVPGRPSDDEFIRLMVEIMVKIEGVIFINESPRHGRGTQRYENWIVEMRMKAEKENLRSWIIGCRYLVEFNAALIYYDDLRACDAIQYLERKVFFEELPHTATQIEKRCVRYYKERERQLHDICEMEDVEQIPKLVALVDRLQKCFKREPKSRGIVLTKTRASTIALQEFIRDEPRLQQFVKVDRLVGKGKVSDYGFMTEAEQQRAIRHLKQGLEGEDGCNLLVATDIAQEGLDIPTCNFVIKYNFVSNEIGAVQARGRARAAESVCYLIVQEGAKNEQREIMNQEKEKLMKAAMKRVNAIPGDDLLAQIKARQIKLIEDYKDELKKKEQRRNTDAAHEVDVVCKECKRFVCYGTDIVRKGTHYICKDPDFLTRVRVMEYTRHQVYRDTDNTGLVYCGDPSCRTQLGPMVRFKKEANFSTCALSCKSLSFKIGTFPGYTTFKIWARCSFPIETEPY